MLLLTAVRRRVGVATVAPTTPSTCASDLAIWGVLSRGRCVRMPCLVLLLTIIDGLTNAVFSSAGLLRLFRRLRAGHPSASARLFARRLLAAIGRLRRLATLAPTAFSLRPTRIGGAFAVLCWLALVLASILLLLAARFRPIFAPMRRGFALHGRLLLLVGGRRLILLRRCLGLCAPLLRCLAPYCNAATLGRGILPTWLLVTPIQGFTAFLRLVSILCNVCTLPLLLNDPVAIARPLTVRLLATIRRLDAFATFTPAALPLRLRSLSLLGGAPPRSIITLRSAALLILVVALLGTFACLCTLALLCRIITFLLLAFVFGGLIRLG
mmetsp:Transcript_59840/g.117613  ORF Transcript_59840/g.117613 Transcript_59840/m.117613 type:complete len:326 (-) Transcript_59840:413-1390(-)